MHVRRIDIQTGSRLHFGIFSEPQEAGRLFRGCGMMIGSPGFCLSLRPRVGHCDSVIHAPPDYASRITALLHRLNGTLTSYEQMSVEITFHSYYSQHTGLGSGTQLAMAVVDAWSALHQRALSSVAEAMQLAGRGERSSIGSTGYFQGGFLIDDGKPRLDSLGSVQTRLEFPEDWRILLIRPTHGAGLAGTAEKDAFTHIDQVRHPHSHQLTRFLDVDIPAALRERNFDGFTQTIDLFGQLVGQQFSLIQGGIYASKPAADTIAFLREKGLTGLGQSSWGPTLFAFCRTEEEALRSVNMLGGKLPHSGWEMSMTRALNSRARVVIESSDGESYGQG